MSEEGGAQTPGAGTQVYCDKHWERANSLRPTVLPPVPFGIGLGQALSGAVRAGLDIGTVEEWHAFLEKTPHLCCVLGDEGFEKCLQGYLGEMLAFLEAKDPRMPRA